MRAVDDPIFVRGMSRSGGTLMVTLLDAHKDVAMSYELYPNLLELEEPIDVSLLAERIGNTISRTLSKVTGSKKLNTFIARCSRGGLDFADVATILKTLASEGLDFSTLQGRLRTVELCGLTKMHRLGKSRWGMKCNNAYDEYLSYWARPSFLNMLRDGRDVLASQLNTGSFNKTPEEVGESWIQVHRRFTDLMNTPGNRAFMVRYEALVRDPKPELQRVCEFLELPLDEAMLNHNKQDLTVFKASHLSADRINKSIDTSRIGRWQRDLSPDQLTAFMAVAKDGLADYGYE